MTAPAIHVVAALITDPDGRVLLVRKRGTDAFMNPGGKPEPGESMTGALRRELIEEIGLVVSTDGLVPIGRFETVAANEPGHSLTADVFRLRVLNPEHEVAAEIEESRWVDPTQPGDIVLAPLAADHLLPLLPD